LSLHSGRTEKLQGAANGKTRGASSCKINIAQGDKESRERDASFLAWAEEDDTGGPLEPKDREQTKEERKKKEYVARRGVSDSSRVENFGKNSRTKGKHIRGARNGQRKSTYFTQINEKPVARWQLSLTERKDGKN